MSRLKSLLVLAFLIIMLAFTLTDYAALHDIWWDFVSIRIAEKYPEAIDIQALPDWTRTKGEWTLTTISLIGRFLLLLGALLGFGVHLRRGTVLKKAAVVLGSLAVAVVLAVAGAMALIAIV